MTGDVGPLEPEDRFTWLGRHQGLLGTVVELQIEADTEATAHAVESRVLDEIRRLESVFNGYDAGSELSHWRRSEVRPGPELTEVLALAAQWWESSSGAFNPAVGFLHNTWSDAADGGGVPSESDRQDGAIRIRALPYRIEGAEVITIGPLESINLNGIAKGWIVDRAVAAAVDSAGLDRLTVNAGGDLVHWGPAPLIVGIEDPRRPYDNVPPLVRVALAEGALATSGTARRGWKIADRWYSHVLDPRTGESVEHIESASVIAPTAAIADVVATALTVLSAPEGLAWADSLTDVGCCLVLADGSIERTSLWAASELVD